MRAGVLPCRGVDPAIAGHRELVGPYAELRHDRMKGQRQAH